LFWTWAVTNQRGPVAGLPDPPGGGGGRCEPSRDSSTFGHRPKLCRRGDRPPRMWVGYSSKPRESKVPRALGKPGSAISMAGANTSGPATEVGARLAARPNVAEQIGPRAGHWTMLRTDSVAPYEAACAPKTYRLYFLYIGSNGKSSRTSPSRRRMRSYVAQSSMCSTLI
jgi:hypothetical protein